MPQHYPWHLWSLQQNRPFLKAPIPPGEEAIKVFCRWQRSQICLCWGQECMEQKLTDPGCSFFFQASRRQKGKKIQRGCVWRKLIRTQPIAQCVILSWRGNSPSWERERERLFFLFQWPAKQHAPQHHLSTTVDWQHIELNSRACEIRSFLHHGLRKPPWTILSELTSIKMISVLKRRKHSLPFSPNGSLLWASRTLWLGWLIFSSIIICDVMTHISLQLWPSPFPVL